MFSLLYALFICYVPILMSIGLKIWGDVGIEWLFFYILIVSFLLLVLLGRVKLCFDIWNVFIFIYSLVVLASVTWTPHQSYTLFNLKRIFARYFAPFIISIISVSYFKNDPEHTNTFLRHVCISAIVLSLVASFQLITGWGMTETKEFRASAFFHNPNGLAIFLVVVLPSTLYFLENNLPSIKMLAVSLITIGIASTGSRKGFGTFLVAFLSFFCLRRELKKILAFSIVISLSVAGFAGYSVLTQRIKEKTTMNELKARWYAASLGFKMFAEHPLVGLGYNGYLDNSYRYSGKRYKPKTEAHNNYATILANYGLLGFVPYLIIFLLPLWRSVRFLLKRSTIGTDSSQFRISAIILISTILPFMINAWFAGGLYANWPVINMLYALIAMGLSRLPKGAYV